MDPREKFAVVMAGFVALLAFCSYAPLIFPAISVTTFGCVLAGFMLFPHFQLSMPLILNALAPTEPFANQEQAKQFQQAITLNGTPLPVSPFPKRVALSISLRNTSLLSGIVVGSIVYTYLYFSVGKNAMQRVEFPSIRFMAEYVVGYFTAFLLGLAWIWLTERRILRRAEVAFGTRVDTTPAGSKWRTIQYSFQDALGVYRGGFSVDFGDRSREYLVLVLYDSTKPNRSIPSCGFIFHKIEVTDLV
ncbi:MAG TPA: hypothetical protein VEN79_07840 [Terriglobia bacterium]|nr:hypothetical protein [Terriglobia bacterium]